MYHSEDRGPASWQARAEILRAILGHAEYPGDAFHTVLGVADEAKLRGLAGDLYNLAEEGLLAKYFEAAVAALRDMSRLEVVGLRFVNQLLEAAKQRFVNWVRACF